MDISKFNEKFNKIEGNTYVIEEKIELNNESYESELAHDNINVKTLNIYTGSKLTGEKIESYSISTPSLIPWKTIIKIFSKITPLYISYETVGDQVEAEDINKLQDTLVFTQQNLNEEIHRATKSENILIDNLNSEVVRSTQAENNIAMNLNTEVNRSKNVEDTINKELSNEVKRATNAEKILTDNLNSEISRSKTKENNIEENINSYKSSNNIEIQKLKEKDIDLQNKKSDLSYVNSELNKRYTKDQTFTREEVLQKIKDVIGTAPEALDTLQEIAKALNNDADFAGTMTKQLTTKVDKAQGKQLTDENYTLAEKNKLTKVENEANKYIHPANHSADIIVDNPNKRFTNDAEKSKNLESYNKKHEHSNKTTLDKITDNLINKWSDANTHINDATRHITSAERNLWNTVSKKSDNGHVHNYNELSNKPSIPTKISELNNDSRFITQKDVDTSQNHIHSNKSVLDGINKSLIDNWNTVNIKSEKGHKHSISEITNMPTSLPANGGTASKIFGSMASNDFIRIEGQGKDDNGSLEIATADSGNEPIYVRQYTGDFANISRTLVLLDSNGNTSCPGTLNANNLQVCGANVYTTNRKPTASDIGAMAKGPIKWNDLKGV
ncbi:hypothetical protein [Clostridium sp. VAP51]|uniref:hypothetical protein n=1 Tax=Clostridium sp. VAP51 TaxID=2949978 RepID=UPI002079ECA7|nr:hypothetical protein [Clostridium sp. VAP51]